MDQYNITPQLIRHVAKLAALDLNDEEERNITEDLNRILGHMRELGNLDTNGIEAAFQTIPVSNVMRKDEISPSLSPLQALQNAPDKEEGYFKIPPILE